VRLRFLFFSGSLLFIFFCGLFFSLCWKLLYLGYGRVGRLALGCFFVKFFDTPLLILFWFFIFVWCCFFSLRVEWKDDMMAGGHEGMGHGWNE